MPAISPRGARRAAPLALVLAGLLAGCSSAHSTGAARPPSASPSATASSDARASAVLAKASTTLAAEHSFRFDASETVTAKTPTTTHVAGAVVRDQGVTYTLTVGHTTTQVVRIKSATYVRKVPGAWARLTKPRTVADPSTSLAAVLTGLTDTKATAATPTTVSGLMAPGVAKAAGIPASTQPAQVTVTVDAAGHVTAVTVHTVTQAGTVAVTVTLVTTYTDFDRVPALRAPR